MDPDVLLSVALTLLFGSLTVAGIIRRRIGLCGAAVGAGLMAMALFQMAGLAQTAAATAAVVLTAPLIAVALLWSRSAPNAPLILSPRELLRRSPDRLHQYIGKQISWRVHLFRKENRDSSTARLTCFPVGERPLGNTVFAIVRSPEVDLLARDAVFRLHGRIAQLVRGGSEVAEATVSDIESYGRRR